MYIVKKNVTESSSPIQMSSGHEGGCEAAIHGMKKVFGSEETEEVLLVDASNAFNSINRKASINNFNVFCSLLAKYVENCYIRPTRLFMIGGSVIKSKEGTTQGDPLSMATYSLGITPLLTIMIWICQ